MGRALLPMVLLGGVLAASEVEVPAVVGAPFAYQPHFRGTSLRYTAEGLPAGVAINATTGLVYGTWPSAGRQKFLLVASNTVGSARLQVVVNAPTPAKTAPPPPPPAKGAPPATATGAKPPPAAPPAEEEDTPDPMLARNQTVAPWTNNQRRVVHHWFLPGAAGLNAGDWFYRISHVAREGYDRQPLTNLLGLDDSVKIGFMVGYSPIKTLTVTLQRINGRDLAEAPVDGENLQYDVWEPMLQWQVLDQRGVRGAWQGPCDLSLVVGESLLIRNHGGGDTSLNLGLIAERDLFNDRLRLGLGVVRAGLSAYEKPISKGDPAPDKRYPGEQDYLASQDSPVDSTAASTTAIPVTVRIALAEHWFLLGEAVLPVAGYRTEEGAACAAGFAYNTNTHEFAVVLSNTANLSFNSVVTGAWKAQSLPFFGFAITAYL